MVSCMDETVFTNYRRLSSVLAKIFYTDKGIQMTNSKRGLFVVWNPFQRRAQSLASMLNMELRYYHFAWEERGKLAKALSYLGKFYCTFRDLFKYKPRYIFIQLAPTPLLYAAALYNFMTGTPYISDCHNTMIYDATWIKWPFAKKLLGRSLVLLVHNKDVDEKARVAGLNPQIIRDPLPVMTVSRDIDEVAGISIKETPYIIVPCGMAVDEPVEELFAAARIIPHLLFVMTWFSGKLPKAIREKAPSNIRFTGFLEEPLFNALYAHAKAALVLTTREGTQPSGAAEAISLGIPLVVSEIATTRHLYQEAPSFVHNEAESIANGIMAALHNHQEFSRKITGLRNQLVSDVENQVMRLKAQVGSN